MKLFQRLLDRLPFVPLLFMAAVLGLAPFTPQPHLIEKIGMLVGGELVRPIDMFDLIWHGLPVLLLLAKLARNIAVRQAET